MDRTTRTRRPGRLARAWSRHVGWRFARRHPWLPSEQKIAAMAVLVRAAVAELDRAETAVTQ